MINDGHQTQLLPPGIPLREAHLDLLLFSRSFDIFTLGSMDNDLPFVSRLLHEDECRNEKCSRKSDADVEVQSPGVSGIEHVSSIQGTSRTQTECYRIESKPVCPFMNEKLI